MPKRMTMIAVPRRVFNLSVALIKAEVKLVETQNCKLDKKKKPIPGSMDRAMRPYYRLLINNLANLSKCKPVKPA